MTTETPVEKKTEINPVFFLHGQSSLPVYLIEEDGDIALVEAKGHDFAFLLVTQKISAEKGVIRTPTMMQMVNTDFGYAIVRADYKALDIKGETEATAMLKLPKIPWEMVERLNLFFREAYEENKTEAAVTLIYDMDKINWKDSSKGWEFFVPNQENTHDACKYNKTEYLTYIEGTNKKAVGTAHSHPAMTNAAYFSHTDDDDQYDFDGVHITCAWGAGSLKTEWHSSLILGGVEWVCPPESLFEKAPAPKFTYPDIKEDLKKVSKKTVVTTTGGVHSWGVHQQSGGYKSPGNVTHNGPTIRAPKLFFPANVPNPKENTIIAVLRPDEDRCRFCLGPITGPAIEHFRCYACAGFMIYEDVPWTDIHTEREKLKLPYSPLVDPNKEHPDVWLWTQDVGGTNDTFTLVHTTKQGVDAKK
jgi:hypothetical protein